MRREKGTSEAGARLGRPIDSRAEASFLKVHAPNYFVTIGIFPKSLKTMSGKIVDKCLFPHWKVEEQPNQKPKKGGDKSAVAML